MNLVGQLRRKGIKAKIDGHTLYVCCPFCGDTRYRRGIELRGGKVPKGTAHCFNAGCPRPNSKDGLQELLGDNGTYTVVEPEKKKTDGTYTGLPEDFDELHSPYTEFVSLDNWNNIAWKYLIDRGLTTQQIGQHHVGLSLIGRARGRVVFPVIQDKKPIGWSGRTIIDAEPKWLHSPGLRTLYWAVKRNKTTVILTEGIFDALAVERAFGTFYDVGAILGLNLTVEKELQIQNYQEVVLFFDPDQAGRNGTIYVAELLHAEGRKVSVIDARPADGRKGDPGELTEQEIQWGFRLRQPWSLSLGLKLRMSNDE